jgi:hypothetical protein
MFFTAFWTLKNARDDKNKHFGDARKHEEDFMSYKRHSYFWFATNAMLIIVPLWMEFTLKSQPIFFAYSTKDEDNHHYVIMQVFGYAAIFMHVL